MMNVSKVRKHSFAAFAVHYSSETKSLLFRIRIKDAILGEIRLYQLTGTLRTQSSLKFAWYILVVSGFSVMPFPLLPLSLLAASLRICFRKKL